MKDWQKKIHAMSPCGVEARFMKKQRKATAYNTWRACPDGEWLIWVLAQTQMERRQITQATAPCIRDVYELINPRDKLITHGLDVLERWSIGRAKTTTLATAYHKLHDYPYHTEAKVTWFLANALKEACKYALSSKKRLEGTTQFAPSTLEFARDSYLEYYLGQLSPAVFYSKEGDKMYDMRTPQCEKKQATLVRQAISWVDYEAAVAAT